MNYKVEKIDEGTWVIKEGEGPASAYMYLLCGSEKAALLDTGFGFIPVDKICAELTSLPIEVILTHAHFDHIGSSGLFEKVYMSVLDENIFKKHADDSLRSRFSKAELNPVAKKTCPLPENGIFDLGGRSLKIIETPGHTPGSICILDESRRLLFTGDICCKAHVLLQMYNEAFDNEADKLGLDEILDIYEKSVLKLLSLRDKYDITWPCHHSIPVKIDILEDLLEATKLLKKGELEVKEVEVPNGSFNLASYKEIGIEF